MILDKHVPTLDLHDQAVVVNVVGGVQVGQGRGGRGCVAGRGAAGEAGRTGAGEPRATRQGADEVGGRGARRDAWRGARRDGWFVFLCVWGGGWGEGRGAKRGAGEVGGLRTRCRGLSWQQAAGRVGS